MKTGDKVLFGKYQQAADLKIGKEPIVWRILDVESEKALLISEVNLDCNPFNEEIDLIPWGESDLRKWLNNEFIVEAFSDTEKASILISDLKNNSKHYEFPNTMDRVFCLSIEEAKQYFKSSDDRKSFNSEYAEEQGAITSTDSGTGWWWLRSRSVRDLGTATVTDDGRIDRVGFTVSNEDIAVRPAIFINLLSGLNELQILPLDKNTTISNQQLIKRAKGQENVLTLSNTGNTTLKSENESKLENLLINQFYTDNKYNITNKLKTGDKVYFGKYKQNMYMDSSKEPIEWRVLSIENGKALLITEKIIDIKRYNEYGTQKKHWSLCTLRTWLNHNFLCEAFDDTEITFISTTNIANKTITKLLFGKNNFTNPTGDMLLDDVFLLSEDEVNEYFKSDDDRIAKSTRYADAQYKDSELGWLLRSPELGNGHGRMSSVFFNGHIYDNRVYFNSDYGIRPAMYINLVTPEDKTERFKKIEMTRISAATKVGDKVRFGTYKQDNQEVTGKEAIEWRVLTIENGRALLIAEKLLEYKKYNESNTSISWSTCTLRKWLNNDFMNEAFTETEKSSIEATELANNSKIKLIVDGGSNTIDNVFILSIDEVLKYFACDADDPFGFSDDRMCNKTIRMNELYLASDCWYLRSPGKNDCLASIVDACGEINIWSTQVDCDLIAVRPAMYVNI